MARALASHETIRLLHVLGDRFAAHTDSALFEDAKLRASSMAALTRRASYGPAETADR